MNEQGNEFEPDVEGHKAADKAADKAGLLGDDTEGHRFAMAIDDESAESDDVEGHRVRHLEGDDADVEGHRNRPDRNRPDFMSGAERNRPELLEDDDVEGHRIPGSNIQPPRDTDLGGSER